MDDDCKERDTKGELMCHDVVFVWVGVPFLFYLCISRNLFSLRAHKKLTCMYKHWAINKISYCAIQRLWLPQRINFIIIYVKLYYYLCKTLLLFM